MPVRNAVVLIKILSVGVVSHLPVRSVLLLAVAIKGCHW